MGSRAFPFAGVERFELDLDDIPIAGSIR